MSTNFQLPSSHSETETKVVERFDLPPFTMVSGLFMDVFTKFCGNGVGAKRPAEITFDLGGYGAHVGRVVAANVCSGAVIGPQARGPFSDLTRALARQAGVKAIVLERDDKAAPGVTVALENGTPGSRDLLVQRMTPPTVKELVALLDKVGERAQLLFAGPMQTNEETEELHRVLALMAPQRVLMAHPSLLSDQDRFRSISRFYDFTQFNYAESLVLCPGESELPKIACRVRYLRENRNFAITNGGATGIAWIDNEWVEIRPCEVKEVRCDLGAGDAWHAAAILARMRFGASPRGAIAYANLVAAALISGRAIPAYQ